MVTQAMRDEQLQAKWQEFAASRLVITDRLHAMIFAVITGTACIAVDNKSKKVSGVYEWLQDVPYVHYCDSPAQVCETIDRVLYGDAPRERYAFPMRLLTDAINK
jgi:pyruvyl transferase EpsI